MADDSPAGKLLAMGDMLGRLAALMGGYKRNLMEEGFSEGAAEEMTADFHREWVAKLVGGSE